MDFKNQKQREIKFRAWYDGDGKKGMYYPSTYSYSDYFGTKKMKWLFLCDDGCSKYIATPLMQFTGLKDKNGKEIYIGDILATSNHNEKENEFIEYDKWDKENNGYTVVIEKENELGVDYSNWAVENDFIDKENRFEKNTIYSLGFVEVVGNIYENPELLK